MHHRGSTNPYKSRGNKVQHVLVAVTMLENDVFLRWKLVSNLGSYQRGQ